MSECAGPECQHPDCTYRTARVGEPVRTRAEFQAALAGFTPEKWATMNRAQRRAAMRSQGRGR